jgi:hypothetical protein
MNTTILVQRGCLSIGFIDSLWARGTRASSSSRIAASTQQSFDAVHRRCLHTVELLSASTMALFVVLEERAPS